MQYSMVAVLGSVPMFADQILKLKNLDHAKEHLYMQGPFDEGSTLVEARVIEEQQAFAVLGVGLVVVERPVILAALEAAEEQVVVERPVILAALEAAEEQVVVAGPVVPVALPAVYYQQGYTAQLAVAHPHQTTIHLLEGCFPHLGIHAQFMCGQDFYCLDNVET